MPIIRDELLKNIKCEVREAGELLHDTKVVMLRDIEFCFNECNVQTVQGNPKITVERVKWMIEKKAEHAMFSVHYALRELLQEINEAECEYERDIAALTKIIEKLEKQNEAEDDGKG
jgi:hypothetical protein